MRTNMQNLTQYGLRRNGIYACFKAYHAEHNKYPDTPDELLAVTSSVIDEKNFQKYRKWFLEFIGDSDVK